MVKDILNNKDILINNREIISEKEFNLKALEYELLKEGRIDFFNKISIKENNINIFCEKTLNEWFSEDNKLDLKLLKNLYFNLKNAMVEAKRFSISENSICLDINTISICNDNFKFTLIPNYDGDFYFDLSKLTIRLLRNIDVNNKDLFKCAYAMFLCTYKEKYSVDDLLEIIDFYSMNKEKKDIKKTNGR